MNRCRSMTVHFRFQILTHSEDLSISVNSCIRYNTVKLLYCRPVQAPGL